MRDLGDGQWPNAASGYDSKTISGDQISIKTMLIGAHRSTNTTPWPPNPFPRSLSGMTMTCVYTLLVAFLPQHVSLDSEQSGLSLTQEFSWYLLERDPESDRIS